MDAYLSIAEKVLRAARRPMSGVEILKRAYSAGEVPARLYGKTQHKTLQARISEDILLRRERSAFFRTKPGVFFLRQFIRDETIPSEFRLPIVARRRIRELPQRNALCFGLDTMIEMAGARTVLPSRTVLAALKRHTYHYLANTAKRSAADVVVWSFVLFMRDHRVLTYRHGRYREGRDLFLKKRTIGFFSPITENDLTLFDRSDHGILASGIRTVQIDLDLPPEMPLPQLTKPARLDRFIFADDRQGTRDLLALIRVHCPTRFEPLTRRLAINDLRWLDLSSPPNHLEDFDPWSQIVIAMALHAPRVFSLK